VASGLTLALQVQFPVSPRGMPKPHNPIFPRRRQRLWFVHNPICQLAHLLTEQKHGAVLV
jgi:hypothetical protein